MSAPERPASARRITWGLFVVLAVVHWDFWLWSDRSLVLGFLPVGLAYHAAHSIAAVLVWAAVMCCAWPDELEDWARGPASDAQERAH